MFLTFRIAVIIRPNLQLCRAFPHCSFPVDDGIHCSRRAPRKVGCITSDMPVARPPGLAGMAKRARRGERTARSTDHHILALRVQLDREVARCLAANAPHWSFIAKEIK